MFQKTFVERNPNQLATLLGKSCLILLTASCASSADRPASNPEVSKANATTPAAARSTGRNLSLPQSRTAAERVQELWARSRPVILADADARLSDSQYLRLREPLFHVWVQLQSELAHPKAIEAERTTSQVIMLIDQVYGYPGYPELQRNSLRQAAQLRRAVVEIDQRIKTLR